MNVTYQKKGIPFVISGPSGSGKGTIVEALMKKYAGEFALSVSATTRAPRPGEEDGKQYYFIDRAEFERRIAADEILEYTEYVGNYYGTPKKELGERTEAGIHVALEIEVEGAQNVRRLCPDAVLIFVLPPDWETLEARLRGRGTNTEEDIRKRLQRAEEEIRQIDRYDYVVINENNGAEAAADEIAEIIRAEKRRTARNPGMADTFFHS